ncbi:MAG: cytochrome b/b6 domain-containing protein [Candidatus Eisenbacteria bacterium]
MAELKSYEVWDVPTRLFHWINTICVVTLVGVATLMMNGRALDVSRAGSLTLKTLHTWIGYVFAINLLVRIVWASFGNRYARWRSFLPWGRGYLAALRSYVDGSFSGRPQQYLGHNPIGRISVTVTLLLTVVLAVTGLVLAGTDLFYPPFGHWFARWVAAPGVDPGAVVPNVPDLVDRAAVEGMRAFRRPFVLTHVYSFYTLLVVIVLHVAGVVLSEIRGGGAIVSATFSGRKILSGRPVDE